MNALPSRLLAVTDRHQAAAPLRRVVESLFEAGLRWLWLRDRDLPPEERRTLAQALVDMSRKAGAVLSIGADVNLAERVGAEGVHLRNAAEVALARQRLGARALVGVSAHSPADCHTALEAGADYATLSPIFPSPSKPGYGPALGPAALTQAARLRLPIVALGGITAANAGSCFEAGAAGIAIMGTAMRPGESAFSAIIEISRRS